MRSHANKNTILQAADKLTDQTANQRGQAGWRNSVWHLERRTGERVRSWECWERTSTATGRGWIPNDRIRVGSFLLICNTER